jgi:hypothetical protein
VDGDKKIKLHIFWRITLEIFLINFFSNYVEHRKKWEKPFCLKISMKTVIKITSHVNLINIVQKKGRMNE